MKPTKLSSLVDYVILIGKILSADRGVDENFNNFYNVFIIYYIAYDCLPITTKQVSNRRVKNPWITSGILTSI